MVVSKVSKLARSAHNLAPTISLRGGTGPRFSRRHRGRQISRQLLFVIVPAIILIIVAVSYSRSPKDFQSGIAILQTDPSQLANVHWPQSFSVPHLPSSLSDLTSAFDEAVHDKADVKQDQHADVGHGSPADQSVGGSAGGSGSSANIHDAAHPVLSSSQKGQSLQEGRQKVIPASESKFPQISAVILFHSEYPTLNHTLDTWEKNGLHTLIDDFLFFLNGIETANEFERLIPRVRDPQWFGKVRTVPSKANLPLGLAIRHMVELARHEYVLLLEKDWALIEPIGEVRMQLSASVSMIEAGTAHVVRFRHRKRPGAPLYAQITYEGRENRILQRQTNLFCYMHHWIDDLSKQYGRYFNNCTPSSVSSASAGSKKTFWCSKAKYCNWTNNPGIFSRTWFLTHLGDPFARDYNQTVKSDHNSHMLDFEFYTNWKYEIWNDRDYIIALPLGLFEHDEVDEQTIQNTVFHGWSRLSTDVSEKQAEYIFTERKMCSHANKVHSAGSKYAETFPLSFVHLYHYNRAMQRTVTEAVEELHAETIKQRESLRQGHGSWRNGITELTNLWQKTSLFTYPLEPVEMTLTFVTAAYTPEGSTRTVEQTVSKVVTNLHVLRHYRNIVYTDTRTRRLISEGLRSDHQWSEQDVASGIQFVEQDLRGMLEYILSKEVVKRVGEVVQDARWRETVIKRMPNNPNSKQPATSLLLPLESEVSFSLLPPLLLRDAEQQSSGRAAFSNSGWNDALRSTTHFVWFDAVSECVSKSTTGLWTDKGRDGVVNDYVFRANMLLHPIVTGRRVHTTDELDFMLGPSGFDTDVFLRETETKAVSQGLHIVDGRTIGGSRIAVTLLAGYYDSVLADMVLRRGVVGSLRELLTIAVKNVEYNFQFFESFERCPDGEDCGAVVPLANASVAAVESTSGCRLYEWVSKCAV